jgi:hypothetical protein
MTTIEVTYYTNGSLPQKAYSNDPALIHRVVLDRLYASTPGTTSPYPFAPANNYTLDVEAKDLAGNPSSTVSSLSALLTAPYDTIHTSGGSGGGLFTASAFAQRRDQLDAAVTLSDLDYAGSPNSLPAVGGVVAISVQYRVQHVVGPVGGGAQDYLAVFRVLKNGVPVNVTLPGASPLKTLQFRFLDVGSGTYVTDTYLHATQLAGIWSSWLTGPFVVAPSQTDASDQNGDASVDFEVPGVTSGDELVVNVEFVGKWYAGDATTVTLEDYQQWDMPSTPAQGRKLTIEVQ